MSGNFAFRLLQPDEYDTWRRLVSTCEEGSNYHLPEYLDALAVATNARWRLWGVFCRESLEGGIATYEIPTRLGIRATSRLLLYYNGPIVRPSPSSHPTNQERHRWNVLGAIESGLREQAFRNVRFKARAPNADFRVFLARGWRAKPSYTYVADVTDLAALWQRFDNNLRRLVRRCETEKVQFVEEGDFENFWRQHQDINQRKGAPLYLPEESFRQFFGQLRAQNLVRLFEARSPSGDSIATQLVLLGPHPVSHTLSAAADAADQQGGANAFLRWRVFEWLAAQGLQANDLTGAEHESVARFKSQLGTHVEMSLQVELPQNTLAATCESVSGIAVRGTRKIYRVLSRRSQR